MSAVPLAPVRVMVVDDSAVVRGLITRIPRKARSIETASSSHEVGTMAVARAYAWTSSR